ncbi:D-beta-hydroxybutyrate dehydrogenase [Raoultella terrigena]|uniref:D-beta-hydroxybutyrate dehydrogenase n=1 Tax=Raoultella terrigena TaxID=577 RepID=A0A3P8KDG5_RAOTE|nr:D-beta-hydroxybutyrate dehydrogenase [Raoultella terrigena]
MNRDVNRRIAVAEGFQHLGQHVRGKGGHRGDGDFSPLQGKALAHRLFGVIPVRQKLAAEKQPSGEFVTPEQLGEMALFLCSDAAAQVRGAAWNMDGGWVAQ